MATVYDINTTCLRYIIPFKVNCSFEEAYKKIDEQKEVIFKKDKKTGKKIPTEKKRAIWERCVNIAGAESDLFEYVRNEFKFEDDNSELFEQKAGCDWIFWKSEEAFGKDGKAIKELIYFPDGISKNENIINNKWEILISNIGIRLCRNGVGFLWYELKLPKNGINSKQLKVFQNAIRELNHADVAKLWEKNKKKPVFGVELDSILKPASEKKDENENNAEEKEKKKDIKFKTYVSPFLFGKWIKEILCIDKIQFFAERKSAYSSMVENTMKYLKDFSDSLVGVNNLPAKDNMYVPDKAILFTYAVMNKKNEKMDSVDRNTLSFHLNNGYKDSYHYSDAISSQMKRPFDDVIWYATQEGASYLAWPGNDNKEVFGSTLLNKIKTDYFALYLKALYQSYSLLMYAERIQNNISAINGRYLAESENDRITDLLGEINLFLSKSMATSVSHIHHQSEFFIYLKEQLRIVDDVKSVTSGLNALDAIQREQYQRKEQQRVIEVAQQQQEKERKDLQEREEREQREKKRDDKLQAIMGLFAMLGIGSALIDWFDFIGRFAENGDWYTFSSTIQFIEGAVIAVVIIVSALAIWFSVKAIKAAFKNKD